MRFWICTDRITSLKYVRLNSKQRVHLLFLAILIIPIARYISLSHTRTFSKELIYSHVCGDEIVSDDTIGRYMCAMSYHICWNTPYATWDNLKTTSWHICWRFRQANTWTNNSKYSATSIYRDHFPLFTLRKTPHSSPVRGCRSCVQILPKIYHCNCCAEGNIMS